MQINADCPVCKTVYHVPADVRGKMMRCNNPLCRHIFLVGGEQAAPAPPPPTPAPTPRPNRPSAKVQRSGSVGDMVPMLSAEEVPALPVAPVLEDVGELLPLVEPEPIAAEEPELLEVLEPEVIAEKPKKKPPRMPPKKGPTPKAVPSWEQAPPVRSPVEPEPPAPVLEAAVSAPELEAVSAPELPVVVPDEGPRELAPDAWETAAPPPVRLNDPSAPSAIDPSMANLFGPTDPSVQPAYDAYPVAPPRKRHRLAFFVGLVVAVLALVGGTGFIYWSVTRHAEADLSKQALDEYADGKFKQAGNHFKQLQELSSTGERKDEFAYLEKLCSLRAKLADPQLSPADAVADLKHFVDDNKDSAFFKTYEDGLARDAARVLTAYVTTAPVGAETAELVNGAEALFNDLTAQFDENTFKPEEVTQFTAAATTARGNYARWQEEESVLVQLRALPGPLSWPEAIQGANRQLRLKKMQQHPAARTELERLYAGHWSSVTYQAAGEELKAAPPALGGPANILTVAPIQAATSNKEDGIVLALARGVLYALRRSDGQLKWWKRVGIDTTTLPVRVPAHDPFPASTLVISADTGQLTAIDDDGKELWTYELRQPSQGRPLIVENEENRLAYVPTYDGQIHVIELAKGQRVGSYNLHHRLTSGGVRQPGKDGKDLLYFPADDLCVYVINPHNPPDRPLERILYTDHGKETLRGEPLIVAPDSAALDRGEGYLVLNQTDGLHAMRLRLFALPLADRFGPEAIINPVPRVPGWTWFQPTYDGEKVVMLSDTGVLGLFGVAQTGTSDRLLYPRLGGGVSLDEFLKPEGKEREGLSQVVQVQGNDFWVLAHGKLHHLQIAWSESAGPRLVPAWSEPLLLGSPQHASQVFLNDGHTTLFLVTRSLTGPRHLATAVDDETSKILWQRQLGLFAAAAPLPLRVPGRKGDPVLLVLDQAGGLFAYDAERAGANPGEHGVRVADAVEENPDTPPLLIPGADGSSAYEIACPGKGTQLLVRHVQLNADRTLGVLTDKRIDLSAPLRGRPAVVGKLIVAALADGSVLGLPLPLNNMAELNDSWRADQAGPETAGHVVALTPERFLVTNGARGFKVWDKRLKNGKANWVTIPEDSDAAFELKENPIASVPVLVSEQAGVAEVCLADAAGVVWLLTVDPKGKRAW